MLLPDQEGLAAAAVAAASLDRQQMIRNSDIGMLHKETKLERGAGGRPDRLTFVPKEIRFICLCVNRSLLELKRIHPRGSCCCCCCRLNWGPPRVSFFSSQNLSKYINFRSMFVHALYRMFGKC